MKIVFLIVFLCGTAYSGSFFDAVTFVESSNNPKAWNEKEQAAGLYQIRPIVIQDLQERGYKFTLQDRWDQKKSKEIFMIYTTIYKATTPEKRARVWNGGPRGHLKPATLSYWNKVKGMVQ